MEQIIFGFSRPKTFKIFSKIIMLAYDIPYSHCYIKLYSKKYDRFLLYQASGIAVNFMNIETFNSHSDVIWETELNITEDTRNQIMQYAIDTCGKPYGVKQILGISIVRVLEFFGKQINNPFSSKQNTLICSELAAKILQDYLHIVIDKDLDTITPKDIYVLLQKINEDKLHG